MGWKTEWKKEKMLETSIFSFSHNVFQKPSLLGWLKFGLCVKTLNVDWIIKEVANTVGKGGNIDLQSCVAIGLWMLYHMVIVLELLKKWLKINMAEYLGFAFEKLENNVPKKWKWW